MKKNKFSPLFLQNEASIRYSVGAKSEFDVAKTVIMHQPDYELYYGIIHPNAALFDAYFDAEKAAIEHQKFQDLLRDGGAEVLTIKQILLKDVLNNNNGVLEGDALNDLRSFARNCILLDTNSKTEIGDKEYEAQELYLDSVFEQMHPIDLVKTILLQPTITLKKTETNTFITAEYKVNPVMNLYFCRDQMITTDKGLVITNLDTPKRFIETKIISFCLSKLGIKPLLNLSDKVHKDLLLEGGDFIMFNNIALIGQGMRTNMKAIDTLMDKDVFGSEYVAVVKDNYHYQPQMHLDTYFNILDKDLVAISDNRYYAKNDDKQALKVSLYQRIKGRYLLQKEDIPFRTYLEEYLKVKVVVISNEDQKSYGLNFLCVGPRKIISIKGQSQSYIQKMKDNNIEVKWVDFANLKQGWGAAHCTTQVIYRL